MSFPNFYKDFHKERMGKWSKFKADKIIPGVIAVNQMTANKAPAQFRHKAILASMRHNLKER